MEKASQILEHIHSAGILFCIYLGEPICGIMPFCLLLVPTQRQFLYLIYPEGPAVANFNENNVYKRNLP